MIRRLSFLVLCAAAWCVHAGSPAERYDVTFVSVQADGSVRRETRPMRPDEILAGSVLGPADATAEVADQGAPPRPAEPAKETVPDALMRVSYSLERDGWLRNIVYERAVAGGAWRLACDHLRRDGPSHCAAPN